MTSQPRQDPDQVQHLDASGAQPSDPTGEALQLILRTLAAGGPAGRQAHRELGEFVGAALMAGQLTAILRRNEGKADE